MTTLTIRRWRVGAAAAVALALLPLGAAIGAGPSGTWSPTGSMASAREQQTATLLSNGAVLVAGGEDCNTNPCTTLSSAELYKVSTGAFAAAGTMATARFAHTATLMVGGPISGTVLIAGGCVSSADGVHCTTATKSAELWNPLTHAFKVTGSLSTARYGHTATLLPTGRVLVAGGCCDSTGHSFSSAELYNPNTGRWAATGSMTAARFGHTATLLQNGQVLVVGGCCDSSGNSLTSAELYNPSTGTWTAIASQMSVRRYYHTATLLTNGQVLVAGGVGGCSYGCPITNSADLYNPSTGTFAATGSMTTPRYGQTATKLKNGEVLVAGGASGFAVGPGLSSAELYNPSTGTFAATGSMSAIRAFQTATKLTNGQVLVTGGYNFGSSSNTLNSAELYNP